MNLLSFASVYFSETSLFNNLQVIQTKKTLPWLNLSPKRFRPSPCFSAADAEPGCDCRVTEVGSSGIDNTNFGFLKEIVMRALQKSGVLIL